MERSVEPYKWSKVANQVEKGLFPFLVPPEVRPRHPITELTQIARETKTAGYVLLKYGDIQPVHLTTFRNELDVFHIPFTNSLLPDYSIGLQFAKDVHRDWVFLTAFLLRAFVMKHWTSFTRPTLAFCMQYASTNVTELLSFSMTRGSLYAGIDMTASSKHRAGSDGSSPWRPSGVADKRNS